MEEAGQPYQQMVRGLGPTASSRMGQVVLAHSGQDTWVVEAAVPLALEAREWLNLHFQKGQQKLTRNILGNQEESIL